MDEFCFGEENSTFRVRPLRDKIRKMPCRSRMLVWCDSGPREGEIVYVGNHEAFGNREVKGGDVDEEE